MDEFEDVPRLEASTAIADARAQAQSAANAQ
jgi:hypothetical protein